MKKVLTILLALTPLAFADDEIAWGPPDNGMRLGLALDQTERPPILRVLIQNTSETARTISLHWSTGCALIYPLGFTFTAISPEGSSVVVVDRVSANLPLIGVACPIDSKVDPGASYEFTLKLTGLVNEYSPPSEPTTLDSLLKAGYVLRVSADLFGNTPHWMLISGELRLPKQ